MRFSLNTKRRLSPWSGFVIVGVSFCIALFWFVEINLKPTLLTISEAKAMAIATEIINHVINEEVRNRIEPKLLVDVKLDNRGRVVLIQPNTIEFNRIATDTTMKIQTALKSIENEKISVPIGQIFGSQLLANTGPQITVTIVPVGTVQIKVFDKFEQAGINQTRHMVYLIATTQIRIVVPLVSKSINVDTQVPIAEYVVIGEVPNTYVQVPFPLSNEIINSEIK